ncbi:efflux RND transporter periplasmic adaptor subunit [Winogradskyella alexanderae]|uniref:Efflux RND transporter periplasmic adaptor subunit n=1 Tax=Winogradskyella alexanderae TaxID=2877123 RepID=A0ABS7XM07_9FLAO|nr:efflux RND transporter periplasmic adaptor subunit [Winogradskyella alexanderae]MCA0131035.1 efflux RND transporter periplasmic adaptor subunit [Winogradskyella alexanderae]
MRKIATVSIISVLLFTCSGSDKKQSIEDIIGSNDITTIQAKKNELVNEQQLLAQEIKQLDEKLKEISPDRNIPLITTLTAKAEEFKHYIELQGSVETKKNVVITPEMPGILTRVYVKEGDKVYKGQLLAKIDDGGLSQQLSALQIQVDLAKTTYERQKRLWEQQIGSEIQFLQAKSTYESNLESINQLKQQLAKSNVRAPFSGVIDDVITEQGNVVAAGQTQLMRIVNLNDMYIETDVPESYITSVVKGKEVEITFPVLGETVFSSVRQTGNFINPANRTFKAEVVVPNKSKNIKPNLTARLKINDYSSENAILIPQSIISENSLGDQYVYVIKDKEDDNAVAHQTIIQTGKTQGDKIEILSGIKAGEELIVEGARSVKNKQSVKVKN